MTGRHHGYCGSGTYQSWCAMLTRCRNHNIPGWKEYGGAGVTFSPRWESFQNFLADMGERPRGTTLDRWPNGAGNYEPGNCRWATPAQQSENRKTTRWIEWNGQTKTLSQWAEQQGIDKSLLHYRLKHWPIDKAMSRPVQ